MPVRGIFALLAVLAMAPSAHAEGVRCESETNWFPSDGNLIWSTAWHLERDNGERLGTSIWPKKQGCLSKIEASQNDLICDYEGDREAIYRISTGKVVYPFTTAIERCDEVLRQKIIKGKICVPVRDGGWYRYTPFDLKRNTLVNYGVFIGYDTGKEKEGCLADLRSPRQLACRQSYTLPGFYEAFIVGRDTGSFHTFEKLEDPRSHRGCSDWIRAVNFWLNVHERLPNPPADVRAIYDANF